MKKVLIFTFVSLLFLFTGCNDSSRVEQETIRLNNSMSAKSFDQLEQAALYVAAGSYLFANCNGNYHCGPCPGFCIRRGKKPRFEKVYTASFNNEEDGAFRILSIGDNTITIKFLTDNLTYNNKAVLEGNLPLDTATAVQYGYSDITLLQGTYDVNPATATAIFNATIN